MKAGDYVLASERIGAEAMENPRSPSMAALADKWEEKARTKQLPSARTEIGAGGPSRSGSTWKMCRPLPDLYETSSGHTVELRFGRSVLRGLVKSGWLRESSTRTAGRPIRRWEVNPQLFTYSSAESAESAESD